MSDPSGPAASPPLAERRELWTLLGYAVALGVLGAFAGLVFMGVVSVGGDWYTDSNPDWFGGHWWWAAVAAAAGVGVGLLRRLAHLPDQTPGLIADMQAGHVDPGLVPGIVAVSALSLMGGASLGPEKALGSIGGGAGTWISHRRRLDDDGTQVNTLAGFAGAYGGLFSSTVIVVMMILEVARPGGLKLTKVLVGSIVASSVSFGIYFAIAGSVFAGAYDVPTYRYHDWQLLAGVGLGLLAAVVVTLLGVSVKVMMRVFGASKLPSIARSTIGGLIFGLVGVALPLTMFTGSDQLKTVLAGAGTLSLGLLVAVLIAKMLTFAVCQASGFVGGPIFPALFMGGTAGVAVHNVFSGVPLGLSFACMLAAVPGSVVSAPFTMVLLAAFLTQIGPLETAPILIAVVTAFLAVEGVQYLIASRRSGAVAAKPETS